MDNSTIKKTLKTDSSPPPICHKQIQYLSPHPSSPLAAWGLIYFCVAECGELELIACLTVSVGPRTQWLGASEPRGKTTAVAVRRDNWVYAVYNRALYVG